MFVLNFSEKGDIKRGAKRADSEFAKDFWENFERGEYDLRSHIARKKLRSSEKDLSLDDKEN